MKCQTIANFFGNKTIFLWSKREILFPSHPNTAKYLNTASNYYETLTLAIALRHDQTVAGFASSSVLHSIWYGCLLAVSHIAVKRASFFPAKKRRRNGGKIDCIWFIVLIDGWHSPQLRSAQTTSILCRKWTFSLLAYLLVIFHSWFDCGM